nr:MAG: head-tail adaptor protein [Pseudomonadota bacterium]
MIGLRIGALRRRLRLEAPSYTSDEGGGAIVAWNPVTTLWAEVIPLSGGEELRADGLQSIAKYEVRIRYRADISPEMRFVFDGRVLEIQAVRDIEGRRRWLSCLCEELGS